MLTRVDDARALIVSTLRTAWSYAAADRVVLGRPRLPETRYPYAVVRLESVAREFTGARVVQESMRFEIAGAFAWAEGADVEELKRSKAATLGDALIAANWAGIDCYMPSVPSVEFSELEDGQPYYGVVLTFSLMSDVSQ